MKFLSNIKIISFDIFDTLVHRYVSKPTDIFRIIEYRSGKRLLGFADNRINAERKANVKKTSLATLSDIYDELSLIYGTQAKELIEIEQETEIACCYPNEKNVSLLNDFVSKGLKVILISDMYLPRETIVKILNKCGIYGYDRLYISCEEQKSKASGSLYDYVLKKHNLKPYELLHIGDNRKSDFLIPLSKGIKTCPDFSYSKKIKVPKIFNKDEALIYNTINACTTEMLPKMNKYEAMGCETFGSLLAGFSQWLLQDLNSNEIQDVYFMSRDGYTMKLAFDIIKPSYIKSHYLYCSRKSYTVPLIWKHSSFDEVSKHITIPKRVTLKSFLTRVGLEANIYSDKVKKYGLDMDYVFENNSFKQSEKVSKFYESIRKDIEIQSRLEYNALSNYIYSLNMNSHIAVVDIGYHGTMQNALVELMKEIGLSIKISGYYVLIDPKADLISKHIIDAHGYLCEEKYNENIFFERTKFSPIFETIFLAPHGTVNRFKLNKGKVVPEFSEYEYETKEHKVVDEKKLIESYQKGALLFVKKLSEIFGNEMIKVPPNVAAYELIKMGTHPTLQQAEFWGDIRFFDYEITNIAHPHSWKYYFSHPQNLLSDYMKCSWKIGFMRRLLKIPLPYYWIYMLLRNKFNRKA